MSVQSDWWNDLRPVLLESSDGAHFMHEFSGWLEVDAIVS